MIAHRSKTVGDLVVSQRITYGRTGHFETLPRPADPRGLEPRRRPSRTARDSRQIRASRAGKVYA